MTYKYNKLFSYILLYIRYIDYYHLKVHTSTNHSTYLFQITSPWLAWFHIIWTKYLTFVHNINMKKKKCRTFFRRITNNSFPFSFVIYQTCADPSIFRSQWNRVKIACFLAEFFQHEPTGNSVFRDNFTRILDGRRITAYKHRYADAEW